MRYRVIDWIKKAGINVNYIDWIGSRDGEYVMSWRHFAPKFGNQIYDTEDAKTELPEDLVIVLNDGSWYEREEPFHDLVHRWAPTADIYSKYYSYISALHSPSSATAWYRFWELNDEDYFDKGDGKLCN